MKKSKNVILLLLVTVFALLLGTILHKVDETKRYTPPNGEIQSQEDANNDVAFDESLSDEQDGDKETNSNSIPSATAQDEKRDSADTIVHSNSIGSSDSLNNENTTDSEKPKEPGMLEEHDKSNEEEKWTGFY